MKNTKRSAFTIVELVIVIAVIAILSAVLIPTFGSIIKDANVANDKITASSLTTELQIYLKGKKIDSEEELMKALDESGVGRKLTPTAAGYGNHFWFDMKNQMIVSDSVAGVKTRDNGTASVESDIQLMAFTQGVDNINVSFREIVREGYFFIDGSGSAIADLLNDIDKINSLKTYKKVTDSLATVVGFSATEDVELAETLVNTFEKSAIITETFATAPAGAEYIYFEPGIKFINDVDEDSLANIASGTIVLPSTVLGISAGALVFGADVNLVTSCSNANEVAILFANGSTNATIKAGTVDFQIGNSDGTTTPFNEDSNVLISNGAVVNGIVLEGKLPYTDFELLFRDEAHNNSIEHITSGDNKGVYINYGYYTEAEADRKIQIYLNPVDGEVAKASSDVIDWTFDENMVSVSNNGLVTIKEAADTTDAPIVITASARGVNGNNITKKVEIYINKITKASVKVATNHFLSTDGSTTAFNWMYFGADVVDSDKTAFVSQNNADNNYIYPYATCNGNAIVSLSVASETGLIAKGSNLVLENGASSTAIGNTVAVSVTIDGCITSTANVTVVDNSKLVFQPNFYWNSFVADSNNAIRYYYVGNINSFKLSDIAKVANGKTFEACDLAINGYAVGNNSYPINSTTYAGELSVTINGNSVDALSIESENAWNAVELKFEGVAEGNKTLPVVITITPKDTTKHATIIELVIVKAKNVYTAAELAETLNGNTENIAGSNGQSAVLLSDIIVTDKKTGNTKFEVGNKALYGNGHVIDAFFYRAREVDGKVLTDEYLIKVTDGGAIENIYLEGPKYFQNVQFNTNEMIEECGYTGLTYHHYVSGIKMIGNSTLSNSFASGFRQPVQVNGDANTETTLDNVTLYGGTFCNLSIMSGNVRLNNVTTVQEPVLNYKFYTGGDGYPKDGAKRKRGLGIVAEFGASDSDITICGNFKQYNWIKKSDSTSLFTTYMYDTEIDFNTYMGLLFNDLVADYVKNYMTEYSGEKYLSAGIVYVVGEFSDKNNLTVKDISGNVTFENGTNGGLSSKAAGIKLIKDIVDEKAKTSSLFEGLAEVLEDMFGRIDFVMRIHSYGPSATNIVMPNSSFMHYRYKDQKDATNFYTNNSTYAQMIFKYIGRNK